MTLSSNNQAKLNLERAQRKAKKKNARTLPGKTCSPSKSDQKAKNRSELPPKQVVVTIQSHYSMVGGWASINSALRLRAPPLEFRSKGLIASINGFIF